MYELKKIGKVFTSKFVGTGPSSYKKRIYRAAVSQRLRNTGIEYYLHPKLNIYIYITGVLYIFLTFEYFRINESCYVWEGGKCAPQRLAVKRNKHKARTEIALSLLPVFTTKSSPLKLNDS